MSNGFQDFYDANKDSLRDGSIKPELRDQLIAMQSGKIIRTADAVRRLEEHMVVVDDHMKEIRGGMVRLLERAEKPKSDETAQKVIAALTAQNDRLDKIVDKLIAAKTNGNGVATENVVLEVLRGRNALALNRWQLVFGLLSTLLSGLLAGWLL